MSFSLDVRRIRSEEYATVGALVRAAYENEYVLESDYLDEIEDVAGRDSVSQVLVAEENGRILGSVTIPNVGERLLSNSAPDEMDVRLLGVSGEARGKGVGEALMRHVVRVARDRGSRRLVLHTGDQMVKAHRLYERLGFQQIPEREFTIETISGTRRIISYGLEVAR
ncbi:GNAT family N-acetyltransferase [Leucobacter viscericola]|uniref:GNAT family N-acetyltransferase n=1 Tax=Leucobacter viscericola TaxID=2714935 RepID=A0A6G7XHC4_9MICO|nr:GNAT family N-acetyltransferase [Leucobacter viscericola]QIK63965.1 GNAT family N-acetyltransferase [Leucobacter viscericola]